MNNRNFKNCIILLSFITAQLLSASAFGQDIAELLVNEKPTESGAKPEKVIAVEHNKLNDKKIEKRLKAIYSELEDLKNIEISISNGIVTLKGEVESKDVQEKAVKFANQIEGVVEVENKLLVSQKLSKRLQKTTDKLTRQTEQFVAGLPIFILAFLVFLLFWLIGKWLSKRQTLFRKISFNNFIADLMGKIVHAIFAIIGMVLALSLLDATALLGTILGAAGIFGLAIGFAVKDTVENFIASILLSVRNPFEVNDFVEIEGQQGYVARLTSRATILISLDGNHIRIPNSAVFKAVIVNFTRKPERRFEFDLGIGTNEDLSQAQALALQMLDVLPGVLKEPKPQAIIHELGDSTVVMRIYGWLDQNQHEFFKVRSEAIKSVKQAIDQANIALPNPIYEIIVSQEGQSIVNKLPPKVKEIEKISITEEIQDTSVDHTAEKEIAKENREQKGENLLSSENFSEL